jgi:ABC-type molybdate transport system substrate-binding protein
MRKLWIILLMGLLVTGCGTGNQVSNNNKEEKGGAGIVAGEMAASIKEDSPLVFQYEVKNQTEQEVTLEFTSSQRYDYSVETKDGKEIFLFSSVANFLQALGEEEVKQGETLSYEIDLHELSLDKGDYILSVWLTPKEGKKFRVTKEFSVE